jgi:two-component system, cell cycle sensor histidine kinase and response regulator CckA
MRKPSYADLEKQVHAPEQIDSEYETLKKELSGISTFNEDVVKTMSDGLVLTDIQGTVTFVNHGFVAMLGYQPEEIIGRLWLDIIPPDHYDMVQEAERRRADGITDRYEMILQQKSGKKLPVLIDASPRFDKHTGEFGGTLGFVTDITRRKHTETALKKDALRYRLLFEQSPIGVFHFDNDGTIVDCNDLFVNIIGSSRKALVGLNMLTLPDKKLVRELHQALNGHTGFYEGVYRSITAEKSTPVKVYMSPLLDKDGQSFGCVGIVEDISHQKQAEDAVRKNAAMHRKMLANIGDVIVIIDQDGINRYKSPNIEKWFGWKPREVVGEVTWKNIHPDDLEAAQRFFADILQKRGNSGTIECRYRCSDGTYKWIEFTGRNLLHDPDIQGLLGNYKDISDRKKTEAERESLQTQLIQAQKMESVGRLAGGVAHDFNNMLTVILGYTQAAMDQTDPSGPMHKNLQEVLTAARRSADLTRQLLTFARKQIIAPKVLDLNTTVESMLSMLRRLIGEDIDLTWYPGTGLGSVKADPSQIDQILVNLCVNGKDAIADVGKISIETGAASFDQSYCNDHPGVFPGEFVMMAVKDDGCGMDRHVLANLFEPFYTTKDVGQGTGLGLATVYGIVQQNKGFLTVDSTPGKGSTFTVYLPRHKKAKVSHDASSFLQEPEATGDETILVVEDEPAILRITCMILERLGYDVLSAGSPDAALALANNHKNTIHLILTDVVMPKMNGRDLAGELKILYPDVRFLFMSGYAADVISLQNLGDKDTGFIQKPFSKNELARKVRKVLDEAKR